ncbi:MAG: hypothetical protein ACO3C4_01645 [Candidatus Limnocylindrus sp.]
MNTIKRWWENFTFWLHRVTSDVPMYWEETGDDTRQVDVTAEYRETKRKRRVSKAKGKKGKARK